MPFETTVTAPPIGVSRAQDWYMTEEGAGIQDVIVRGRLIGGINQSANSSNADPNGAGMALTAPYVNNPVQIGGKWVRMAKVQGSMSMRPQIPLSTFMPTVRDVGWPQGRYIWEGVFYWSGAPGPAVDSGLMLALQDNARILGALVQYGIGLGNRNGGLVFYSRGPGGFEAVPVDPTLYGALNLLNKLTLVLRQPGFNRPASVTALVNDRIAAARTWAPGHKLPLPDGGTGALLPHVAHASTVVDCWVTQLRFSSGPDLPDL